MTEADQISAWANVPHELAELVVMRANQRGLRLRNLRSQLRHPDLVDARHAIAKEARGMHYSFPVIGRALSRDHTSVMHLLRTRG